MSRDHEGQENQSAAAKKHKGDYDAVTRNSTGTSSSFGNSGGPSSGIVPVVKPPSAGIYDSCK